MAVLTVSLLVLRRYRLAEEEKKMNNRSRPFHVKHERIHEITNECDVKATHPHRYNIHLHCSLSASSLTVTTNQKESVSLCNGRLYQTYFGIGQSQLLSEQCRCIVAMWMGGFGRLMQWSLTCKVQEPCSKCCKLQVQNFCCCSFTGIRCTQGKLHTVKVSISSNINLQQNGAKMYPSCEVMFN